MKDNKINVFFHNPNSQDDTRKVFIKFIASVALENYLNSGKILNGITEKKKF